MIETMIEILIRIMIGIMMEILLKKLYALSSFFALTLSILSFLVLSSTNACANTGINMKPNLNPNAKPIRMLILGDSLSAAYGIPVEKGWVNLLRGKLDKNIEIINASISGETTQGGLTRLPAALEQHKPDILLLELGANDGLRGISTKVMHDNLNKMIEMARTKGMAVALLGIKIPPNYGIDFTQKFEKVFSDLADKYKLPFDPFFLDGVATNYDLMQIDGLHPNVKAQPIILKNVMPIVKIIVQKAVQ